MKILAFDPGSRHVVWTLTQWEGNRVVEVTYGKIFAPNNLTKHLRDTYLASHRTMQELAQRIPELPDADQIVVEMQHVKDKGKNAADLMVLSGVAGAIMLACMMRFPHLTPVPAFTDSSPARHAWSTFEKPIRHARLLKVYCPDSGLERKNFKGLSMREYGDALDTVAMAYWLRKGCPRRGV